MTRHMTIDEHLAALGEHLRALRLQRNVGQRALAEQAGVSLHALKSLESGAGSTLRTLVSVVRALGREDWLSTIAPIASINPLTMPRDSIVRQRASKRGTKPRTRL